MRIHSPGAAPLGDDWLHETKFDGYRCRLTVRTSSGLDWTDKFQAIADAEHTQHAR